MRPVFSFVYVHRIWYPQEGIRTSRTEVSDACEPSCKGREPNSGLQQKPLSGRLLSHLYSSKVCFLVSTYVSLCVCHAHEVVLKDQKDSGTPGDGATGIMKCSGAGNKTQALWESSECLPVEPSLQPASYHLAHFSLNS